MNKITLFALLIGSIAFSQVGVGTTVPQAALDISSTNNGLLIPRIALTSTLDITSVINPDTPNPLVNGTLIYNTATAGLNPNNVTPGFYSWNTTLWTKISNGTKSELSKVSSIIEPNATIPGALGTTSLAGTNNTAAGIDATIITRTIVATGYTGNTALVTCDVQLNTTWGGDIDLYLQSPTGQIVELSTDNGGFTATIFNVTFSDAGAANITTWAGGNVTGVFRPEGTTVADVLSPNITTMSGFNGFNPNGTWTLHVRDDAVGDILNFVSFNLSIATSTAATYRLVDEVAVVYKQGHDIIINSNYSANSIDNEGVVTALTSTTASAGAIGTLVANLTPVAYNKLSYASDSARQGSGNFWLSTHNQSLTTGLVNGSTYYYQLWVKGNIETPLASNEQWSIIPMQVQK